MSTTYSLSLNPNDQSVTYNDYDSVMIFKNSKEVKLSVKDIIGSSYFIIMEVDDQTYISDHNSTLNFKLEVSIKFSLKDLLSLYSLRIIVFPQKSCQLVILKVDEVLQSYSLTKLNPINQAKEYLTLKLRIIELESKLGQLENIHNKMDTYLGSINTINCKLQTLSNLNHKLSKENIKIEVPKSAQKSKLIKETKIESTKSNELTNLDLNMSSEGNNITLPAFKVEKDNSLMMINDENDNYDGKIDYTPSSNKKRSESRHKTFNLEQLENMNLRSEGGCVKEIISVFKVTALLNLNETEFALGSSGGKIQIRNKSSQMVNDEIRGHGTWIESLIKIKSFIASASYDKTIKIWDLNPMKKIKQMNLHQAEITAMLCPDDEQIISGSKDSNIIVWNIEKDTKAVLKGHTSTVMGLSLYSQGKIASAGFDQTIMMWSLELGLCTKTLKDDAKICELCQLDFNLIAVGTVNGLINIWNLDLGVKIQTYSNHSSKWIYKIIRINSSLIASASGDKTIRIWDYASGKQIKVLIGHHNKVNEIILIDSNLMLSASEDKTMRIWRY